MRHKKVAVVLLLSCVILAGHFSKAQTSSKVDPIRVGMQTFRFDTFGDEAWWGDTLHLHQAIEGAKFGGVGPGVSPRTALAVCGPPAPGPDMVISVIAGASTITALKGPSIGDSGWPG